jgi:DNA-directed RNA polymerase subunit H (RpoH/RPB5)
VKKKKTKKKKKKKKEITIPHLHFIVEIMKKKKIKHYIIIIPDDYNLPEKLKRRVHIYSSNGFCIEFFKEGELMLNITKHKLASKHILLSPKQREVLFKKYKQEKIPKLKIWDPMVRYFGAKKDDVFKIFIPSETCGLEVKYRIVVLL